jgi:hypothetical protein
MSPIFHPNGDPIDDKDIMDFLTGKKKVHEKPLLPDQQRMKDQIEEIMKINRKMKNTL